MKSIRLAISSQAKLWSLERPFSSFDFVDSNFGGCDSIRRLFSLSRSLEGKTLLEEDLPNCSDVTTENDEITAIYPDYKITGLKRLSFWSSRFSSLQRIKRRKSAELLGYAILKKDTVPSLNVNDWHVFESVFIKYPHKHNCVSLARLFRVCVRQERFSIRGVKYCQQNGLNKSCAHVALKSLCASVIPSKEISYKKINQIAEKAFTPTSKQKKFLPRNGLQVNQIRAVLDNFNIGYMDIDYGSSPNILRTIYPFQKLLYAGVESGGGALLAFSLQEDEGHIIPFFGHTFNKDTWIPDAEKAYFHVGETRYIPSDSWVSNFIAHDDNFGSNFCVPPLYLNKEKVQYVLEVYRTGCKYSGVMAEAIASLYLYSLLSSSKSSDNIWFKRLLRYVQSQQVILRAIALTKIEYANHLQSLFDWKNRKELKAVSEALRNSPNFPEYLWMIEVSVPDLFPANKRKVGEIVLNATDKPSASIDFKTFLLARFPGKYMLLNQIKQNKPSFVELPSSLQSHTPIYMCN